MDCRFRCIGENSLLKQTVFRPLLLSSSGAYSSPTATFLLTRFLSGNFLFDRGRGVLSRIVNGGPVAMSVV